MAALALPLLPLMIASTALTAGASIMGGYQRAAALKSQEAQALSNANTVALQSSAQTDQKLREGRYQLGAQSAGIAESGIGFSGTGNDVLEQSSSHAMLDALNTQYAGTLQSTTMRNQALQDRRGANMAVTSGWIGAGSTVLKAASSYAMGGGKIPGMGGVS